MKGAAVLSFAVCYLLTAPPLGDCRLHPYRAPIRPRMFPQVKNIAESKQLPNWRDLMKTMTLFDAAKRLAKAAEPFARKYIEVLAQEESQRADVAHKHLSAALDALLAAQDENCASCETVLGALKAYADNDNPFENVGDPLIKICEDAAIVLFIDPVMCNGTINIQGPHVYEILKQGTAKDFCETLNACYPPANSKKRDVRSRLPWKQERRMDDAIPRMREAANTTRVAQLTDIHIQPKYAIGSPADCQAYVCCLEDSIDNPGTNKDARPYGEYKCNIPERTMHLFLNKVAELQPDIIIYSGDTPPHTMWDETRASQLNCSNILVNALRQVLTGYTVYPNIGNHEMYPTNLYHEDLNDTMIMNEAFADAWQPLAGFEQAQMDTMKALGYYTMTVPDHPKLRILSINTVYDWYIANFYATLHKDTDVTNDFKAFVTTTLSDARTNNEKVIVIGHHPTGGDCMVRASRWWEEVAIEFGDVIVLHVAGHTHDDSLRLFMDSENQPKSAIHVTPSVTSNTNVNPSMRIFTLDSATYQPLEMENYYFDVEKAGDEEPDIVLNYRATEEYGLADLSAASWQDFVLRLVDDDALFQKWYVNYHTGNVPENEETCNTDCKERELCRMWFASLDEIEECYELIGVDEVSTTAPSSPEPSTPEPTSGTARGDPANIILILSSFIAALSRY